MTPTVERIQKLFTENNEIPAQVFHQLGMQKNALTIWKKGSANPSTEAIIKLSNHFSVTTDYLLTGKIQESDLCEAEKELIRLFRLLPDLNKERIKGYIDGQLDSLSEASKKL